eukprot:1157809-Pelagomonas_calceolata.AAC.12
MKSVSEVMVMDVPPAARHPAILARTPMRRSCRAAEMHASVRGCQQLAVAGTQKEEQSLLLKSVLVFWAGCIAYSSDISHLLEEVFKQENPCSNEGSKGPVLF